MMILLDLKLGLLEELVGSFEAICEVPIVNLYQEMYLGRLSYTNQIRLHQFFAQPQFDLMESFSKGPWHIQLRP